MSALLVVRITYMHGNSEVGDTKKTNLHSANSYKASHTHTHTHTHTHLSLIHI